MRNLTTVLATVGALACWYFVVAFWVTTAGDWHRRDNPGGRHLMAFTANLGVVLTLIVAARVWGDYPGREVVTLVAFAALVSQVVWRCVLLHLVQHDDREPAGRQ